MQGRSQLLVHLVGRVFIIKTNLEIESMNHQQMSERSCKAYFYVKVFRRINEKLYKFMKLWLNLSQNYGAVLPIKTLMMSVHNFAQRLFEIVEKQIWMVNNKWGRCSDLWNITRGKIKTSFTLKNILNNFLDVVAEKHFD